MVCNEIIDIDIVYAKGDAAPARPANTAHNVIAGGFYPTPSLIPAAATGKLIECVRYLTREDNNIYWRYDDPYIVEGPDGKDGVPGKAGVGLKLTYNGIKSAVAQIIDPGDWFIGRSRVTPVSVTHDPLDTWNDVINNATVVAITDLSDGQARSYLSDIFDISVDVLSFFVSHTQWIDWFATNRLIEEYQWRNSLGDLVTRKRVIFVVERIESATPDSNVRWPGPSEDVYFLGSHAVPGASATAEDVDDSPFTVT